MEVDPRKLLNEMAKKERNLCSQDFIAPFTPRSKIALIKLDGLNYKFRIVGFNGSGFGLFRPIDASCAKYVRTAPIEKVRQFLELLPRIHLILAYEADQGWVAYPMNMESATSSLGLQSEAIVLNVSDCERFDVITARYDGMNFWYDEIFVGADPVKSEAMRECFLPDATAKQMQAKLSQIKGITPEDKKSFDLAIGSWIIFKKMTTEAKISEMFSQAGAKLGSYVVRGANIDVRWTSTSGREYRSTIVKETFDVVSAGICLAGGDKSFHLKDLPFIIEEGEKRQAIYRTEDEDEDDDDDYEY